MNLHHGSIMNITRRSSDGAAESPRITGQRRLTWHVKVLAAEGRRLEGLFQYDFYGFITLCESVAYTKSRCSIKSISQKRRFALNNQLQSPLQIDTKGSKGTPCF